MERIPAKSIVSGYVPDSSWFGNNYNMNIYKGCSHGCIYCDSRSSCYGVEDFDRVRAKEDAIGMIRVELRSKKKKGVIGTGAMSDPYNPMEKKYELTRQALELVDKERFGISIATKSDLISRDIDVLSRIKEHSPVLVKMTITTVDDELAQKIEPYVASTSRRFDAIRKLSEAGIFVGVLLMPILPFINDNQENIVGIVKQAKRAGAKFVYAYGFGVTLRDNQRVHFYDQLNKGFGEQELVKAYIREYGNSYECSSPDHKLLWQAFINACEEEGMIYKMKDIIKGYKKGYQKEQLSLF